MGWEVSQTTQIAVVGGQSSIIQTAESAGSGSTAAFSSPVTPGNSVIAGVISTAAASVAPSSGPDTFTADGSGNECYWFHVSASPAGGYTGVTVTGANCSLFTMEVYGAITFDTLVTNTSVSANWASGTYTPAVSSEVLLALAASNNSGASPTVTSSGWTSYTTQSSGSRASIAGRQLTTSTAGKNYTGSWSLGTDTYAGIAGYEIPSVVPATPASGCVLYYTNGQLWALGQSGTPVVIATT
jgi:hypothetical protein